MKICGTGVSPAVHDGPSWRPGPGRIAGEVNLLEGHVLAAQKRVGVGRSRGGEQGGVDGDGDVDVLVSVFKD